VSTVKSYAAQSATTPLAELTIERRVPKPTDVQIEILYCGVCHSDLHTVRNEWGGTVYPVVPGHEIVGRVTAVGNKVTKFKVGDLAGIGCMVDSSGNVIIARMDWNSIAKKEWWAPTMEKNAMVVELRWADTASKF